MAKFDIIRIGTAGIDMRKNPLFIGSEKLVFAKNVAFREGDITVRPSIAYHDLGVSGQYQGSSFFTPSSGLSAISYSESPDATAIAAGGEVFLVPIWEGEYDDPIRLDGGTVTGNVTMHDSENYLIVLQPAGTTYWYSCGYDLVASKGLSDSSTDSHDTFDANKHQNFLPNNADVGAFIHGRNHISMSLGSVSGIVVSDLLTKRGFLSSDDIILTEEYARADGGDMLTAPSSMGKTVAFAVMPSNNGNGEGELFDFREKGTVRHDTMKPRQTRYSADGKEMIKQGWSTMRLTNKVLQNVGAVGNHAVSQLPSDIFFRSQFGLHFMKFVIGEGTLNDETVNTISQDVEPFFDFPEGAEENLSGAAVGHWLKGSRFFASVGFEEDPAISTRSFAKGFVSMNQATNFTEDRTPRPLWEGLWVPANCCTIHKFEHGVGSKYGQGFIGSKGNQLVFGQFLSETSGVEDSLPIPWALMTGAFPFHGLSGYSEIKDGNIEIVVDETTTELEVLVRTDSHQKFKSWKTWDMSSQRVKGKEILSNSLGLPHQSVREFTWAQFLIRGKGYFQLRNLTAEVVSTTGKRHGNNKCVPLVEEKLDYFTL